jgi:hypothetical protein
MLQMVEKFGCQVSHGMLNNQQQSPAELLQFLQNERLWGVTANAS